MALLLFHPGVAKIDCGDCQKRLYDLETGEPKTYRAGPNRELRYYEGQPPPCKQPGNSCPKGSPETAHEHELSDKNWRVLNLYRRGRVTGFENVTIDALLAENLAIVDELYRSWERWRAAEASGSNVASQLIHLLPALRRRT